MLSAVTNKLTRWVAHNIEGSGEKISDFSRNQEAERIDREYERIEQGLERVGKDLAEIDEKTKLHPPALRNIKDGELILMGATTGGAVGTGLGLGKGVIDAAFFHPEVDIKSVQYPIYKQSLAQPNGWTMKEVEVNKEIPVFDDDGNQIGTTKELQGWQREYTPSINKEEVGKYTVEKPVVSGKGGSSPLASGLTGLAVGAGLGALVGTGVVVARKLTGKGAYDPVERRSVKNQGRVLLRTGTVGAAAGAAVGLVSAALESSESNTVSYTVESPVMQREVIGKIPQDYFVSALSGETGTPAQREVEVDNPVMKWGVTGKHPAVESHTEQFEVTPDYGYLAGVLGGAVVGGLAGVALGVTVNVLRKSI